MANFWAKRIGYDISRINEVPKTWRDAVRQIIEDMHLASEQEEPEGE